MDGQKILRALNKTFSLFHIFRFEVRVHWTLIFFALYFIATYTRYYQWPDGFVLGSTFLILLYGIVLIHELGHSLAARRLRIAEKHILLSPLGGLAGIGGHPRSPREEIVVTAWGPAVHPVMLIVIAPLYFWLRPEFYDRIFTEEGFSGAMYGLHVLQQLYWINLGLLLFNLIPAFPMDGGRLLRAFLAQHIYAAKATVIAAYIGQAISILFIIGGVIYGGDFKFVLVLIGIMNIIVCEQAKSMAPHVDPYGYATPDDPYGLNLYDPGSGGYADPPSSPGFFKRLRQERAQRKAEQQMRKSREIRQRVDEILAKVSESGMESLTREEKRFLDRASRTYQKK